MTKVGRSLGTFYLEDDDPRNFYQEDDDLWALFTWRMTIPGHFLLGEVFTPDTFPFEEDNDPWALFTWRSVHPWHFSLGG